MPYPNPLGFYSLELAPKIEAELINGDLYKIADLISEIATLQISPDGFVFCTCFSNEADQAIEDLKPSQQIALMRWAAERLEWLHSQQESNFND